MCSWVHRSSHKYRENRPEKPDGRWAALRSRALEPYRYQATAPLSKKHRHNGNPERLPDGRWLAGRLMKELGLVAVSSRLTGINVVVS